MKAQIIRKGMIGAAIVLVVLCISMPAQAELDSATMNDIALAISTASATGGDIAAVINGFITANPSLAAEISGFAMSKLAGLNIDPAVLNSIGTSVSNAAIAADPGAKDAILAGMDKYIPGFSGTFTFTPPGGGGAGGGGTLEGGREGSGA